MNNKEFEEFSINYERNKTDRERWMNFEHTLRYLLCELKDETERKDNFLLDTVKHSIVVFVMKDKFKETNEIFLQNMKHEFYVAINEVEKRHPDIEGRTFIIKLFMADFYFNDEEKK